MRSGVSPDLMGRLKVAVLGDEAMLVRINNSPLCHFRPRVFNITPPRVRTVFLW